LQLTPRDGIVPAQQKAKGVRMEANVIPRKGEQEGHRMGSSEQTIVICGATGKQGGAVLNSLLKVGGWNLVALSRDVNGTRAGALRERGVAVRYADLDDADSLAEAFSGAYGVYGVTTMLTPKGKLDMELERRQGRNIADACVANRVQHVVLSTIPYFGDGSPLVPYIRSKLDIETYVVERGVPYTFLGPGSFMDEIGGEYLPVKKGVLTGQAADDVKVPYVALSGHRRVRPVGIVLSVPLHCAADGLAATPCLRTPELA